MRLDRARAYHEQMKRELPVTCCTECGRAGYNMRVANGRCSKVGGEQRCSGANAVAAEKGDWIECVQCQATGYYRNKECPKCKGAGYLLARLRSNGSTDTMAARRSASKTLISFDSFRTRDGTWTLQPEDTQFLMCGGLMRLGRDLRCDISINPLALTERSRQSRPKRAVATSAGSMPLSQRHRGAFNCVWCVAISVSIPAPQFEFSQIQYCSDWKMADRTQLDMIVHVVAGRSVRNDPRSGPLL
jgi:hypothetical protein